MAQDMRAMVEMVEDVGGELVAGNGLIIHDGPTWNARRLDYDVGAGTDDPIFKPADNSATPIPIPWGTSVKVDRFIELPNGEVWYRLADTVLETATRYENGQVITEQTQNDAWIAAYGGDEGLVYTDVNDVVEPCGAGRLSLIGDDEEITFFYDRIAAAKYGIAHAYRNSITVPGEIYPDANGERATNWIDPQNTYSVNNIELPYYRNLLHAKFIYI